MEFAWITGLDTALRIALRDMNRLNTESLGKTSPIAVLEIVLDVVPVATALFAL